MIESISRISCVLFYEGFLRNITISQREISWRGLADFPSLRLGLQNRCINRQVGKHAWRRLAWPAIRRSRRVDNARYSICNTRRLHNSGGDLRTTGSRKSPAAVPPRRLNHATPTCVSLALCTCEMETRRETQRVPLADLNEREARLARRCVLPCRYNRSGEQWRQCVLSAASVISFSIWSGGARKINRPVRSKHNRPY